MHLAHTLAKIERVCVANSAISGEELFGECAPQVDGQPLAPAIGSVSQKLVCI